jgi:hypothetical protein
MDEPTGRPLRIDANGDSGGEAYGGFPLLRDVRVDGFILGMISDWEAEAADSGDAFVMAPDGSTCGLDWEVSPERRFQRVCRPDADRWGVWYVTFPHEMTSRENARLNLEHVLPDLRPKWEAWSTSRTDRLRGWLRRRTWRDRR